MPLYLRPPRPPHSASYEIRGTYLGIRIAGRSTRTGKLSLAKKALKELEHEIECGRFAPKGGLTFAAAAAAYMRAGGERTYVKKILEYFGETPLSRIDQSAIDAAAAAIYPSGSGATQNRHVYTPISAILRRAGHRLDLHRPRAAGGNATTSWLRKEEAFRIFDAAEKSDPRFAALLIFLCYTGARLSEALNLTWSNVELQNEFAYIPDTKNGEPRAAYLPPVVVAALAGLERCEDDDRVFRLSKSSRLYAKLWKVGTMAGVTFPARSAFHIFRHTFASLMRQEAGADEKTLLATGAWKDRKSVDRYTHVVISDEARKAALLPVRKRR